MVAWSKPTPPERSSDGANRHVQHSGAPQKTQGSSQPEMSPFRGLVNRSSAPVLSSYARLLLTVLTAPLIARALGTADRGWLAIIFVVDAMTNQLFSFGLPQAITVWYVTKKSQAASAYGAAVAVIHASVPFALLLAVATAIVWDSFPSPAVKLAMLIVIVTSPLTTLAQVRRGVAVAGGRYSAIVAELFLPTAIQTAIVTVLFALGRLSLAYAVVAVLAGRVMMVMVLLWRYPAQRELPGRNFRPLVSFGARAWATTFLQWAVVCVDDVIIFFAMGPAQLGVYAVGSTLAMLPEAVPVALGGVLLPSAGRLDTPAGRRAWEHLTAVTMALTWALTLFVSVVSPFVVPLAFGADYRAAGWVASIGVLGAPLFAGFLVRRARLEAVGRPGTAALCQAVGLAVLVVGMTVAVSLESLYAVAAVTVGSSGVRWLAVWALGRRLGVGVYIPRASSWPMEIRTAATRIRPVRRDRGSLAVTVRPSEARRVRSKGQYRRKLTDRVLLWRLFSHRSCGSQRGGS